VLVSALALGCGDNPGVTDPATDGPAFAAGKWAMTDHLPGETPLGELEALPKITPGDIEHAKTAWRENARPGGKGLLDAEPIPAKSKRSNR
jgi:hypothetical protein